jgi:uncharacterized protein YndB with AHSA1/START domain
LHAARDALDSVGDFLRGRLIPHSIVRITGMKTSNENDASPTDIDRDAPAIIRLERVIPAHRQRIWDLHADVAGWPKWQLDIATASIDGPLAAGSALTWTTAGLDKPIVSTIHAVEPHRSTLWSGPASGIVGIHRWAFDDTDAGTRVTTEESWGGAPVEANPTKAAKMLETSLERWLHFLGTAATS